MTDPTDTSPAAWFHAVTARVAAAHHGGDTAEVARLLDYIEAEGDPDWRARVEHILSVSVDVTHRRKAGLPGGQYPMGNTVTGQLICDFCGAAPVVAYYPFTPFDLAAVFATFDSGDKMHVCARCRQLVDADDWKGLKAWVGPAARTEPVRMLWWGFRQNRTGDAVEVDGDGS